MKNISGKSFEKQNGFTLVMTLAVLAAVTILVVGLFSIVSRERSTSGAFDAVEQADLAVQAGLENAGALLKQSLRDENGMIVAVPTTRWVTENDANEDSQKRIVSEAARKQNECLMAMNFLPTGDGFGGGKWIYQPLASGVRSSEPQADLPSDVVLLELGQVRPRLPQFDPSVLAPPIYQLSPARDVGAREEELDLKAVVQRMGAVEPWKESPACYWVDLDLPALAGREGSDGEEILGRFCFFVEDLQGRLNLAVAGNEAPPLGFHQRTEFEFEPNMRVSPNGPDTPVPNPGMETRVGLVPGLNLSRPWQALRSEQALHTIFQPNVDPKLPEGIGGLFQSDEVLFMMNRVMMGGRLMAFTPTMWREVLLQPDPLRGWAGLEESQLKTRVIANAADTLRESYAGSLANPVLRRLEQNTVGGIVAYDELAVIPFSPGIQNPGERKMNLNVQLDAVEKAEGEVAREAAARLAVDQIASHISRHLPTFGGNNGSQDPDTKGRKGGYPLPIGGNEQATHMGYLKCLAAGMIDYADTDGLPTMDGDPLVNPRTNAAGYPTYRGMDAFPIVTEQWQRYRAEFGGGGQFSVTQYVELWNMTNVPISGEVTCAYEIRGKAVGGLSGGVDLSNGSRAVDGKPEFKAINAKKPGQGLVGQWHQPVRLEGDDWVPGLASRTPIKARVKAMAQPAMQPNEHRIVAFEPVVFAVPTPPIGNLANIRFEGPENQNDLGSRYRVAFRPTGASGFTVVDQPLVPMERLTRNTSVSGPETNSERQQYNLSLPGMSYSQAGAPKGQRRFANNVGDPRGAFFIDYSQDVVTFNSSSPWARNIRQTITSPIAFHRENRVFLWPDGGHNSVSRTAPLAGTQTFPDDRSLRPAVPQAGPMSRDGSADKREREKYVQRLSNSGRFFSVTELGHVFDPIMWDANGGDNHDEFRLPDLWRFANLESAGKSTASGRYCGGNTLRVGRVEHERFRMSYSGQSGRPETRAVSATALLDLFHCGKPTSADPLQQLGDLVRIDGEVNVNTASREALRAILAGRLEMDPRLSRSRAVSQVNDKATMDTLQAGTNGDAAAHADLLAGLIIRHRPYVTPAEIAEKVVMLPPEVVAPAGIIEDKPGDGTVLTSIPVGEPVFGASLRTGDTVIEPEWNDAAAEEAFARLFNNVSVRSRNFRIVVTGQALRRTRSGEVKVLASRSRLYHVFVRPVRDVTGLILRQEIEITYARTL